jgi:thiamine pyrophosphate-dependent acetolactate synthase large subunit-like protein
MKRYDAMLRLAKIVTAEDLVITSLGGTKNEWYAVRPGDGAMYLTAMGGVTAFAFGVALALPHRRVLAFDTDGSLLMNPGILCTLANELPANLTVLCFDNAIYETVGNYPTATSRNVDLERLAAGAGIPVTATARDPEAVSAQVSALLGDAKLGFLCVKTEPGAFRDLAPHQVKTTDGIEDKYNFIRHVERLEKITIKTHYTKS